MKVLVETVTALWGGGTETLLRSVVNELNRRGHTVTLVVRFRHIREARFWLDPGVRCIRRNLFRRPCKKYTIPWFFDRIPKKIWELVSRVYLGLARFDLVIAMIEGGPMKRALRDHARRRVAWIQTDCSGPVHGIIRSNASWTPAQELACMRRFERVICVSRTVKDSIIETMGDPGNLCVRYLPIDADGIRERAKQPCDLQRSKDKPLIVSVSRLVTEKQIDMLLAACEKLRETMDFELWIIGDGPERPKLETHIKNKRLDFARMLGGKENPFPYLRQADLFVSASLTESYGLSAQEALVLGIPVVAVGCRGIRESLGDCFGLLVDNSAAALAEGIRTMLQTPGMLEQYRDTIARDYPADRLFGERLEAIMELLEQDPGACPER